jgi:hypothetical protein
LRLALPLLLAGGASALAGCGSAGSSTLATPLAPVTAPISGAYRLSIRPDPACAALPPGPHAIDVVAAAAGTSARPELRVTLPGGDASLSVEMLYEAPGRLRGSIGTQLPILFPNGYWLFVRAVGEARVSVAADGRGEIVDASLAGEMLVGVDEGWLGDCSSLAHRFSLRTR